MIHQRLQLFNYNEKGTGFTVPEQREDCIKRGFSECPAIFTSQFYYTCYASAYLCIL